MATTRPPRRRVHALLLGAALTLAGFGLAGPGASPAFAAAPVCQDVTVNATAGTPLALPIGSLCSDADGDSIVAQANSFPQHGSLAPDGAGGGTYTAISSYSGPDSFTYHGVANGENSNVATVSITVTGGAGNEPPQCFDSTQRVYDSVGAFLSANCFDPDSPYEDLSVTSVSGPQHGQLSVPFGVAGSFYTPDPGFLGTDSISYKLSDGSGESSLATATLEVVSAAGNLPPTCPASHAYVTQGQSIILKANCVDPDHDPITYSLAAPSVTGGTIDSFTSTSVRYTPFPGTTHDVLGYSARDFLHPPVNFAVDIDVLAPGDPCCETAPEATPAQPFAANVTAPVAGPIYVDDRATTSTAPTGYTYLGQEFDITAPDAVSPSNPLKFVFKIDQSQLDALGIAPAQIGSVTVFRNGTAVPNCATPGAGVASPTPCIDKRELVSGDLWVTALTMQASVWNLGLLDAPQAFDFTGFYAPVNNRPVVNKANSGQAIPIKFSLAGSQGLNVLAGGYPKSQVMPCGSNADFDGVESTATSGASGLSYDASSGRYTYVWKTEKSWANTCRQLVLKFADEAGSVYRADFSFKK